MITERRATFSSLHPDTKTKLAKLEHDLVLKRRRRGHQIDRLDDPRRKRGRALAKALAGYGFSKYGSGTFGES